MQFAKIFRESLTADTSLEVLLTTLESQARLENETESNRIEIISNMDLARQAAIKLRKMTTNAYQKVEASYTSMLSYSRQSIKTTSRSHLIDLENMLNDWRKTQLQNCFEILSQVKSTNEEREALEDAKAKLEHQKLQLLGQIQEQEQNHTRSILQITTERDEATAIIHESQGVLNNFVRQMQSKVSLFDACKPSAINEMSRNWSPETTIAMRRWVHLNFLART